MTLQITIVEVSDPVTRTSPWARTYRSTTRLRVM